MQALKILVKLDQKTGKATEFQVPTLKPGAPTGSLGTRFDRDGNIWLGMLYQAGVARFDRRTGTFKTWKMHNWWRAWGHSSANSAG